jgi:hypothetical protein
MTEAHQQTLRRPRLASSRPQLPIRTPDAVGPTANPPPRPDPGGGGPGRFPARRAGAVRPGSASRVGTDCRPGPVFRPSWRNHDRRAVARPWPAVGSQPPAVLQPAIRGPLERRGRRRRRRLRGVGGVGGGGGVEVGEGDGGDGVARVRERRARRYLPRAGRGPRRGPAGQQQRCARPAPASRAAAARMARPWGGDRER